MIKIIDQSNNATLIYIKLAIVSMIWGGTFVAGRYISTDLPPLFSASLRFIIASIILTIFLIFFHDGFKKISFAQFFKILILGFFGIYSYNIFFFYGLHFTNAATASLIVATNPAVMAIFCYLFYKEKVSTSKFFGIVLCICGASTVILFRQSSSQAFFNLDDWIGNSLIFGCVLSWVIYSVFCRSIVKEIGAIHTVTYSIYVGTILLFISALINHQLSFKIISLLTIENYIGLFYLGAIGSALAYIWYYDGIQKIGATRSGVFIALNPFTAILCGVVLLDEHLSIPTLFGGTFIMIGIYLSNK
ncbi:MAG: DMT family transporter [Acinetobacter sp.]